MDTGRRGFLKVLGLGTAATAATAVAQVAAAAGPTDPLDGATYLGAIDLISARADGTGKVEIVVDRDVEPSNDLPPICLARPVFSDLRRNSLVFESWADFKKSVVGFNPSVLTGSHALLRAKVYLQTRDLST